MKGLLLRNLYTLRIPVLIVAALALLMGAGIGVLYMAMYLALVYLVMLETMPLAEDVKSGFESWRLTMPVSRKDCVNASFLTVLMINGSVLLVSLLCDIAATSEFQEIWYDFGIMSAFGLLLPGVLLLLTSCFGFKKAGIMILPLMLVFVGVMRFVPGPDVQFHGNGTSPVVTYQPYHMVLTPVCLAVFVTAWLLSLHLIEKREF